MGRWVWLAMVGLLGLPICGWGQSTESLPPAVSELLSLTNQERAEQGLAPLRWSAALADAAAAHDARMVQSNVLEHQLAGEPELPTRAGQAGAHFQAVAENLAIGPDAGDIARQWMHSAPHRANILDPRMNQIGIALMRSHGSMWAVEDFADGVASLDPEQIELAVIGLLKAQGLARAISTEDARRTCAMERGSSGNPGPRFIMRWEGSDLSRLPDVLTSRLRTGQYHSAAVGACEGTQSGEGFTAYRVAVLLY